MKRTSTPRMRYLLSFAAFLIFWFVSGIHAPAGSYLFLQHIPTVVAAAVIGWLILSRRIDGTSLSLLLIFWALHCVGARWIYSYVPYDEALRSAFGSDTHDWFGWTRNNYDRLVHLMYGVCHAPIFARLYRRAGRSRLLAAVLAVEFVIASSAVYELAEWGVAVTMAPDWADSYLGQQGDPWDAQKDMALAGLGSLIAVAVWALRTSKDSHSDIH